MSLGAAYPLHFVGRETNNPYETSCCWSSSMKATKDVEVPRLLDAREVEEYLQLIEGTAAAVNPAVSYESQCLAPLAGCERGLEDIWNFEEPSSAGESGSEWDVEVSNTLHEQRYDANFTELQCHTEQLYYEGN